MAFFVQYVIDDVGYAKTVEAANAEKAKAECEEEMKAAHPTSVCVVTSVEEVSDTIKSKKKKKSKDDDKEEE